MHLGITVVQGLVLWVRRRFRIRRGYLIAAYAAFYAFGQLLDRVPAYRPRALKYLGLRC